MGAGALTAATAMDQIKREALEQNFLALGKDDAETLTKDEIMKFLQDEDKETFTDEVCEIIWDNLDKNDDGNVMVHTFKVWLDNQKRQVAEAVDENAIDTATTAIVPDTSTTENAIVPDTETTEKSQEGLSTAVAEKSEENPEVVEKTEEQTAVPLGKSASELMSQFNLSQEQMSNIETCFNVIDESKNKTLEEEEFVNAMSKLDPDMPEAKARENFHVFDKNRDGVVTLEEFTELVVTGANQSQNEKKEAEE